MNQKDLLDLAKKYFIFDAGISQSNLIRKIQVEQGHADCFATGKTSCDQMACHWRQDCHAASAENAQTDPVLIKT